MQAINKQLEHAFNVLNDDLANQLDESKNDIEEMLEVTGDPDLIIGMINEICTRYLNHEASAYEMIDNLKMYRYPADVIYQVEGTYEPVEGDYVEMIKTNQYVNNMYNTEREQYEKHEMSEENLLPCPRCKSKAVVITSRQLKSGDEGMTMIQTCEVCKWQSRHHS